MNQEFLKFLNMSNQSKILEKIDNKIIIDPKILPYEERKFLIDFIEFLIKRRAEEKILKKIAKPEIKFKDWTLNIKSRLNRKEIYDYL